MSRKIFVTTALPYSNGPFHIGHIMEYIQADIWVRFQRMQGNRLHFVCADDAHGAPIMLKAEEEGISPQQLIARIAAGRPRYLEGFHLSFDHWHSTLTGAKPVLKTSDHFFFKLSEPKCVRFLEEWLGAAGRLQPQVVNKAREWLTGKGDQALGDWDISRDAPYFGIPIPDAPGKYFYVWLDAPIGYLAALKSYFALGKAQANGEPRSFEAFLAAPDTEQIHFIGKDIIYFHTLFWPAMLKFAGAPYRVPNHVYVHGFITVSGEKMSKSRGTGISPLRYLDLGMNAEWLRYYIAAKLNANVEDIDFNPDDFVARVNSDLVGKYVNIASRIAPFLLKFFGNRMPPLAMTQIAGVPVEAVGCLTFALQQSKLVRTALEEREFGKAIRLTMEVADVVNAEIDGYKPWLLAKDAATNEQSRQKLGKICEIGRAHV